VDQKLLPPPGMMGGGGSEIAVGMLGGNNDDAYNKPPEPVVAIVDPDLIALVDKLFHAAVLNNEVDVDKMTVRDFYCLVAERIGTLDKKVKRAINGRLIDLMHHRSNIADEEVGESDTEVDVVKEWGGNMDNGGEEEEYQGDVVRRSKQDSKIIEKMAAFNVLLRGKERKGSKAAATTRHDGGGESEIAVGMPDGNNDVAYDKPQEPVIAIVNPDLIPFVDKLFHAAVLNNEVDVDKMTVRDFYCLVAEHIGTLDKKVCVCVSGLRLRMGYCNA
jgi:hypothetical protein